MKNSKQQTMSALCVAQPWASCIIEHGKNVENAGTNLRKRGTIAIYASKSKLMGRFEACKKNHGIDLAWADLPKGCIIGFVDIVDVIQVSVSSKTKEWFQPGAFGYVLRDPILLKKPVPAAPPNGAIKFWHLKGKALRDSLKQVSAARQAKFKEWRIPD